VIVHADATHPPALSVVVVVFDGGRSIKRMLEALNRQDGLDEPVEIIVAMSAGMVNEQTVHSGAPSARLVRGRAAAHPSELRALGVRLAAAPIVVCTEDHCIPTRDWCARIIRAHREAPVVIGGAIDKLRPDRATAWAAYLLEYGRFMPPLAGGPVSYLSDCNVSYKRSALDEIVDEWRDAFHETRVHDVIRQRAGDAAIVLDPLIVVLQSRRPRLGAFLAERFAHGRLFARLRAANFKTSERLLYAVAALGLSPVLVARALKHAWRGSARMSSLRALPVLIPAACSWALGETVGALTAAHGPAPAVASNDGGETSS